MTPVEPPPLSAAASALDGRLREGQARRADLPRLWQAFVAADPAHAADPEKRARLAALLDELAAAGRVAYPSARSWERTPLPPLPRFVTVVTDETVARRRTSLDYAWHEALAWAATARLSPGQIEFCQRVNRFLADGGARRPVVPIRERSLELCGDEKRLEAMLDGALFGPRRLTLALLRAERVAEPFAFTRLGEAPLLLVAENATTYRSLVTALPADGPVGVVAFGRGWQFCSSVVSAAGLDPPVSRIAYFGDIDAEGLRMAARAAAVARAEGLPPVEPAAVLYRLLLSVGTPQPARGGPIQVAGEASALAAWLPADERGPVADLLAAGRRLAQEWVGAEVLLRHREEVATGFCLPRRC